ncbi:hypothetical protein DFH06DRAFT_1127861 [Mycena polygramma]|nr:hypothetical protein DFH06DRAFT_1127861 [Mycena polygramma]
MPTDPRQPETSPGRLRSQSVATSPLSNDPTGLAPALESAYDPAVPQQERKRSKEYDAETQPREDPDSLTVVVKINVFYLGRNTSTSLKLSGEICSCQLGDTSTAMDLFVRIEALPSRTPIGGGVIAVGVEPKYASVAAVRERENGQQRMYESTQNLVIRSSSRVQEGCRSMRVDIPRKTAQALASCTAGREDARTGPTRWAGRWPATDHPPSLTVVETQSSRSPREGEEEEEERHTDQSLIASIACPRLPPGCLT